MGRSGIIRIVYKIEDQVIDPRPYLIFPLVFREMKRYPARGAQSIQATRYFEACQIEVCFKWREHRLRRVGLKQFRKSLYPGSKTAVCQFTGHSRRKNTLSARPCQGIVSTFLS